MLRTLAYLTLVLVLAQTQEEPSQEPNLSFLPSPDVSAQIGARFLDGLIKRGQQMLATQAFKRQLELLNVTNPEYAKILSGFPADKLAAQAVQFQSTQVGQQPSTGNPFFDVLQNNGIPVVATLSQLDELLDEKKRAARKKAAFDKLMQTTIKRLLGSIYPQLFLPEGFETTNPLAANANRLQLPSRARSGVVPPSFSPQRGGSQRRRPQPNDPFAVGQQLPITTNSRTASQSSRLRALNQRVIRPHIQKTAPGTPSAAALQAAQLQARNRNILAQAARQNSLTRQNGPRPPIALQSAQLQALNRATLAQARAQAIRRTNASQNQANVASIRRPVPLQSAQLQALNRAALVQAARAQTARRVNASQNQAVRRPVSTQSARLEALKRTALAQRGRPQLQARAPTNAFQTQARSARQPAFNQAALRQGSRNNLAVRQQPRSNFIPSRQAKLAAINQRASALKPVPETRRQSRISQLQSRMQLAPPVRIKKANSQKSGLILPRHQTRLQQLGQTPPKNPTRPLIPPNFNRAPAGLSQIPGFARAQQVPQNVGRPLPVVHQPIPSIFPLQGRQTRLQFSSNDQNTSPGVGGRVVLPSLFDPTRASFDGGLQTQTRTRNENLGELNLPNNWLTGNHLGAKIRRKDTRVSGGSGNIGVPLLGRNGRMIG